MRGNQISIKIQRFGDQVPAEFMPPEGSINKPYYDGLKIPTQIIHVYADSDNLHEALCAAFYEALAAIQEYGEALPERGDRQHHY